MVQSPSAGPPEVSSASQAHASCRWEGYPERSVRYRAFDLPCAAAPGATSAWDEAYCPKRGRGAPSANRSIASTGLPYENVEDLLVFNFAIGCFGKARAPGTLFAWLALSRDVLGRVHKRDVGEGLREVADGALRGEIVLFGQQAQIVGQADEPLVQALGVRQASGQNVGVCKPEAAREKGAFTRRQSVVGRGRVVPEHQPAPQQLLLNSPDGAQHACVVGR